MVAVRTDVFLGEKNNDAFNKLYSSIVLPRPDRDRKADGLNCPSFQINIAHQILSFVDSKPSHLMTILTNG